MLENKEIKRGLFTSSTFLRYWGKPISLKRVNVHASGVNYLLQFLTNFFQFPNCQKQESKVDVPVFCLYYVFAMSPSAIYFKGSTLFLFLEQVGMCAGVEHQQFQLVIMLFPDQQPVGQYMTFPLAFAVAMKNMGAIFGR